MTIDLTPFCSTDPERPGLHQPFSLGEWTYATDGAIAVRVARREDVPERKDAPDAAKVFSAVDDAAYLTPLAVDLPPESEDECPHCEGSGLEHPCEHCEHECPSCKGTGKDQELDGSVGFFGISFALRYARMALRFPGVRFAPAASDRAPMPFRFDGGEGVLMPLRGDLGDHAVVKFPKAAE